MASAPLPPRVRFGSGWLRPGNCRGFCKRNARAERSAPRGSPPRRRCLARGKGPAPAMRVGRVGGCGKSGACRAALRECLNRRGPEVGATFSPIPASVGCRRHSFLRRKVRAFANRLFTGMSFLPDPASLSDMRRRSAGIGENVAPRRSPPPLRHHAARPAFGVRCASKRRLRALWHGFCSWYTGGAVIPSGERLSVERLSIQRH